MINQRPVDQAMAINHQEKYSIRKLWLEEIIKAEEEGYDDQYPLYLTLPGSAGIEIGLLIENGILRTTETGAILEDDAHKIVAVESSKKAQVELLKQYPGINVLKMSIKDLMRGESPLKFSNNKNEVTFCKAKIINLDLNEPIKIDESINEIKIPVIEWIKKFCLFHREDGIDWSLLAKKYVFSGGYIKNAVLSAIRCMLSRNSNVLDMEDLIFGAESEAKSLTTTGSRELIGFAAQQISRNK